MDAPIWVDLQLMGDGAVPAIASGAVQARFPWQKTVDTGGNSAVSFLSEVGNVLGGVSLAMTAANEVQEAQLHWGDALILDVGDIYAYMFDFRFTTLPGAASVAVMGLASESEPAGSCDEDTIPEHVWFKIEGAASTSAIVAESDDGTTDVDDKATGVSVSANNWHRACFDFKTQVDGLADIAMYLTSAHGPSGSRRLRRVATGSTFRLDNYTTNKGLQPYFAILKASGTNTGTLQVANVKVKVLPQSVL